MLTTERPWTATAAVANSPTDYGLRLHGGTEDERLISIPPGKHSIGSGPRCSLRLQYAGVQPLECLIVRDESGLRVRRWSDDTRLNGVPFDDASLTSGDVLSLGPVDLEVVAPQSSEPYIEPEEPTAEAAELAIESVDAAMARVFEVEADLTCVADSEAQALQPTETDSEWDAPEPAEQPAATVATTGADDVSAERRIATSIARRRSRRVLAAVRRQRNDFNELVTRVSELAGKVEQILAAPQPAPPGRAEAAEEPAQRVEARIEPDAKRTALETELGDVRGQLARREAELSQARYAIDALERQLIDSQHTMNAFADERLVWEAQFTELELRLANYFKRIQELERQLDQVRAVQMEDASRPLTARLGRTAAATVGETAASAGIDSAAAVVVEEPAAEKSTGQDAAWEEVVGETVPAEMGQDAVETVAEPVEAASEESVAEVDAAIEDLRGLSIWRQEPEVAAEGGDGGSTQVAVDETGVAESPKPTSFIDRYAHLFPADDAVPETPVAPPQPPATVAPTPETHADEESVEQYMSKLLERMRGGTASDSATSAVSATEPEPAVTRHETHDDYAAAAGTSPEIQPITDLEELKPRAIATELASDRMAMRALANQSARYAIGVHTARTLRRNTLTRFIIAVLGASAGLYLLLDAPGWNSLQFAAGCVAAFAAIYWGKLTLGALIKGIQVGAFEDFDEDLDPEKTLYPPLPIDVERESDPWTDS